MDPFFASGESGPVYRLSPDSGNGSFGQGGQRFDGSLESPSFSDFPFTFDASCQQSSVGQQHQPPALGPSPWPMIPTQTMDWSHAQPPVFLPSYSTSTPACINELTALQEPPFVPADPTPVYPPALAVVVRPTAPGLKKLHPARITKGKTSSTSSSSSSRRVVFTAAQNRALCALYERVANVRLPEREVFGRAIGLNEMQVKIWLQNRRYKDKKARPAFATTGKWKYDKHYETERVIRAIEYSVAVFNHCTATGSFSLPPVAAFQPNRASLAPTQGPVVPAGYQATVDSLPPIDAMSGDGQQRLTAL